MFDTSRTLVPRRELASNSRAVRWNESRSFRSAVYSTAREFSFGGLDLYVNREPSIDPRLPRRSTVDDFLSISG